MSYHSAVQNVLGAIASTRNMTLVSRPIMGLGLWAGQGVSLSEQLPGRDSSDSAETNRHPKACNRGGRGCAAARTKDDFLQRGRHAPRGRYHTRQPGVAVE